MLDLCNALESAAKSLIDAESLTVTVYTGQTAETQVLPAALCHCQGGPEDPQDTGNYRLQLAIMVMSNADDSTLATHMALCSSILSLFSISTAAASLSAQSDNFEVIGLSNRTASGNAREDDHWVTTLTLDAYCCRSDLT